MANQLDFIVRGGLIAPGNSTVNNISITGNASVSGTLSVVNFTANTMTVNTGEVKALTSNTAAINVATINTANIRALTGNTASVNTLVVTVSANIEALTSNTLTVNTANVVNQTVANTLNVKDLNVSGVANLSLASGTVLKAYRESVTTNNSVTSTYNINLLTDSVFDLRLTGNTAVTISNIPASNLSASFTLIVSRSVAGLAVTSWPANTVWSEGIVPTQSTGANQVDVFTFTVIRNGALILGAHSYANVS